MPCESIPLLKHDPTSSDAITFISLDTMNSIIILANRKNENITTTKHYFRVTFFILKPIISAVRTNVQIMQI